ncbi:MAG TPA: two-component regulator propeller domain-containing protein, partial [Balneolaceae bacterium]|nr:two-component regulator propeller domain-containing protein [Balneolaceae bacterium]
MKRLLSVLVLVLIITVSISEGQVLPITFYTADSELNPLPSAEVHQVMQDRMGYVWMAVYSSGMVRYNSVKMEVYDTDNGLRDLTVWDMIEDSTGRLWVSSNAGLVATELPLHEYPTGKKINFVSDFDDTPLVDVAVNHNRMSLDKDGWLWVGTETLGIVRYRFNRNGVLESDTLSTDVTGSGTEISVRSLLSRENGSVWVSLRGGKFLNFFPGKEAVQYDSGSDINTNSLFESADGDLWGGKQNGQIWKLEERDGNVLGFIEVDSKLESNISDISSASDHSIWVSSEGSGLQVINPEDNSTESLYTRINGFLGDIIYNVFEDREKNIWIAQSGGVSKLRYNFRAFQNITASSFAGETPVLPSPSINGLLPSDWESDPCALWAGTSEGGLACIDDNFLSEVISDQDGLTSNWVNGMSYDQAGRLWIGTSRGMNSLSFGNTKPVAGAEGSENVSIFGRSAVLSTYPSSSVLAVNKLLMPVNSEAGKWVESIWFPAYRAVNILVNDKLYKLDSESGLPAVIYHAAAFDEKGHLWAGTRDRGIYRST